MNPTHLGSVNCPDDLKALTVEELEVLASEIRTAIYEQVSQTGGHLAPNLGVVELTLALHYVFDFAHDRLLFDVGHQCYPHKLITGRYPLLSRLRTRDGMSGFPNPHESAFDHFAVGHAGTAISTAVGIAHGDTLKGDGFDAEENTDGKRVVAFVGDASIVNGISLEGLNNAGTLKRQFLVVLNDNGMSIAKPQGAVAAYLDRVRTSRTFRSLKKRAKGVASKLPGGAIIGDVYHRLGEVAKASVSENALFEHFDLLTIGPVDGHDLKSLIELLAEIRDFDRPLVLHVHTTKGKGFEHCESDATTFHSPKPFEVQGKQVKLKSGGRSFTAAFSDALTDLMQKDTSVVAATAAMADGTGLTKPMNTFPNRVWDTGICESHALDMLAGMAYTGQKPFFAVYSTFLQRAFDQAFQEVALQGLAVRLCLDRAGLVGGDGAVHHGFCDISLLRVFPNAVLLAAMDEPSLVEALECMRQYDLGLSAVRYPRDVVSDRFTNETCPPFELGKARPLIIREKPDVAILAYGVMTINAAEALDELKDEYRVNLYDARFAKPIDIDLIRSLVEQDIPILTIEDHSITSGFGSCVLDACHDAGISTDNIYRLGIPERWITQDSRSWQLENVSLDPASIAREIRDILDTPPDSVPTPHTISHTQQKIT